MSKAVDLLREMGVEISDDLAPVLVSKLEQSDEFKGLIETKNDLLKFKQDTVAKEEQIRLEREQAEAAALAEREQLAREKNDFAELAKIESQKREAAEERASALMQATLKSETEAAKTKVSSLFEKSHVGVAFANMMTKTELTDSGEVKVTYQDGDFSTNSYDEFKEHLAKSTDYSAEMKSPQSATPSAQGGSGSVPKVSKKPKDMTSAERLALKQSDPDEFRRLFNL